MKNRILSVILTLIMLVSMMSAIAVPTSAATIAFTYNPSVLISGDGEYNIVWQNNNAGIGYVTYKVDGVTYTVYDEENGVVRSDDYIHTVRVPQEHLDAAGSYTVVAKTVSSRDGYTITTSDEVTKTNTFNGYKGQENVTFGFTSDTHWRPNADELYMSLLSSLVNNTLGRPDVMVLNGDITDSLSTVDYFNALFEIINVAGSDGTYPVLYTVGNHEKRGEYAKEIEKYLTYSNGEFYTYFEYGPLAAFVADVGEDKNDSNISYTQSDEDPIGAIDMERYFAEQLNYFKKCAGYGKDATYTFTIGHGPKYIGNNTTPTRQAEFIDFFNEIGADVHFYGHNHQNQFHESTEAIPFPIVGACSYGSPGSKRNFRGAKVTFGTDADGYDMYNLVGYGYEEDEDGNPLSTDWTIGEIWSASIDADANGKPQQYVEPEVEEEADTTTSEFEAPSPNVKSDTVAITTAPVVFDAGDYYNVVWQTDVESVGYVYVDGVEKYYMNQHGGIMRTETVHSVRVPKADLAGKTFIIMNRVVERFSASGHYSDDSSLWLKFGEYATGPAVKLNAMAAAGEDYTVLAVANKTAAVAEAEAVLAKYTDTPDLVVLTGDVVSALNTEADFAKLLTYANTLTKGKIPVMLLRGENETKGAYAAELTRILHTFGSVETMNKLYGATTAGNTTVIGLDTATKSADSTYTYAAFDALKAEQADWLKNGDVVADGNYGVVFANAENEDMAAGFANQNVQLAVVAGETTSYTAGEDYALATIGDADALVITCAADTITVAEISDAETPVAGELTVTEKTPTEEPEEPEDPVDPKPEEPEEPVVGPTVAKIGDVEYDSVEDAINAATTGQTVQLVADATAGMVMINSGVTLDLNGKKLTATYVVGFDGSNVIDTYSEVDRVVNATYNVNGSTKTGGIYVSKDNVILSNKADRDETSSNVNNHKYVSYIPVYDAQEECYKFIWAEMRDGQMTVTGSNFQFMPIIGYDAAERNGIQKDLFATGNLAGSGVSVGIRVTWVTDDYTASQVFTMTDKTVKDFINGFGYVNSGRFTNNYKQKLGASFTGEALKQADYVYISAILVSNTGVELESKITEVDTTTLS